MICYDKRYLRTSRLNTIVEPHYGKDEEGNETILGYVYCDKSTFTDCILLQAKFDNNLTSMVAQIAPIEKHMPVINYFFEEAPKPFNVLAPFLGLISGSVELEKDIEDLVSRLFVLSKSIGFNSFIQVPKNLRMSLVFSTSEFNRYKADVDSYKKFMYESMKEESPSEVLYINTEEVERFAVFMDKFREMGIIGASSASYSGGGYNEQISTSGSINMDYDPSTVDHAAVQAAVESGAVPAIDFGALFGNPGEGGQSNDAAPATAQPLSQPSTDSNVGAVITSDGVTDEEDEMDILDKITLGIDTTTDQF